MHCFRCSSKGKRAPSHTDIAEADILLAEVRSLLQSDRRRVCCGIFGGQIHEHPDKERGEGSWVPLHFPVASPELAPLEQRCKMVGHDSEVQILTGLNFPSCCPLFPTAWLKSKFLSQVMLVRILPPVLLRLAFEISRSVLTTLPVSRVLIYSTVAMYHVHSYL